MIIYRKNLLPGTFVWKITKFWSFTHLPPIPQSALFSQKGRRGFMKDKITNSMLELMQTQNFSKINIAMICRNVPISRTTFYHYFSGKGEIIEYFVEQDFLKNSLPIFKFHLKQRGVKTFFSYLREHRDIYQKLYHIDQGYSLYKALKRAYLAGFERRSEYSDQNVRKKPPMNPDVFSQYTCSGLAAVMIYWIKNNMDIPEEQMANDLYLMMEEPLGYVRDYYV